MSLSPSKSSLRPREVADLDTNINSPLLHRRPGCLRYRICRSYQQPGRADSTAAGTADDFTTSTSPLVIPLTAPSSPAISHSGGGPTVISSSRPHLAQPIDVAALAQQQQLLRKQQPGRHTSVAQAQARTLRLPPLRMLNQSPDPAHPPNRDIHLYHLHHVLSQHAHPRLLRHGTWPDSHDSLALQAGSPPHCLVQPRCLRLYAPSSCPTHQHPIFAIFVRRNASIPASMNSWSSVSALCQLVPPELLLLDSTDGPSFWGEGGGSSPTPQCPARLRRALENAARMSWRRYASWMRSYPLSAARGVCSVLCVPSGSAGDDWSSVCDKGRSTYGKPRESNANRLCVSFCRRRLSACMSFRVRCQARQYQWSLQLEDNGHAECLEGFATVHLRSLCEPENSIQHRGARQFV